MFFLVLVLAQTSRDSADTHLVIHGNERIQITRICRLFVLADKVRKPIQLATCGLPRPLPSKRGGERFHVTKRSALQSAAISVVRCLGI